MNTLIGLILITGAIAGVLYLRKKNKSKSSNPGVPVSSNPTDVVGDNGKDVLDRQGKFPDQRD